MGRLLEYFMNKWPYTDFHELNADWLISSVKELIETMDSFIQNESISFADPITWNITTQYAKATVVIDSSGNAYLSKQPVPSGIQLNNSEYWQEIFNFTNYTRTANRNLTVNVETNTTRATVRYNTDDWLIWNDVLYRVTRSIAIDDTFIVSPSSGYNIVHFTVEDFIKAFMTWARNTIQQYKNDIDASELEYKNAIDASELEYKNAIDASELAFTTNLQNQFNQAVAGLTVDSEVLLARMGWNGKAYTTLADALQNQFNGIIKDIAGNTILPHKIRMSQLEDSIHLSDNLYDKNHVVIGRVDSDGYIASNTSYVSTDYIEVEPNTTYYFYGSSSGGDPNHTRSVAEYNADCTLVAYYDNAASITTNTNTKYIRACFGTGYRNVAYIGKVTLSNAVRDYIYKLDRNAVDYDFDKTDAAIEKLETENYKHITNFVKVPIPSVFTWKNNPVKDKLFIDFKGTCYCDLNIDDYKINNGGRTYYVDYVNGDDTNNGISRSTAFKTMGKAYSMNDIETMILLQGCYPSTGNLYNTPINKSLNIIGEDGVYIVSSAPLGAFTQTTGYNNVYEQNAQTAYALYDITGTDDNGDIWKYTAVNSVSQCENTPASYCLIGGVLYVHCFDNRAPQVRELWRTSGMTAFTVQGSCSVYFENITVFGGDTSLRAHAESSDDNIYIYANKCTFMGSKDDNYDAVMLQGTKLSIFKNCKALYSYKDGFNYHARNNIIPKAIEINCTGKFNGTRGDSSHQGSTIHDGGSIIRINGVYNDNYGPNIADDGAGTESFNINCVSYNSKGHYNYQNACYFAFADVNMFLDSCTGFSSYYNVSGAGNKYVRNYHFTGEIVPPNENLIIY